MGRIESEAIRMTSLVESLLTLARLDETAHLTKSSTDLVALSREAGKDVAAAELKRSIRVVDLEGQEIGVGVEVPALVDANSIRQVLINLLANASRFSPKGESIDVALGASGDRVVIEVRDHGEGIAESLREKIFERFYRVDNSRNSETGGSGLGLAICRAIVDRHGGDISAHETSGGGATLRVSLPN
jgi:two-component system OmpR family sensor kinase